MPAEYPEALWRCPVDGAFHIADMADHYFEMDQYRCTKCEGWVNVELIHEGMANAINRPEPATAPPACEEWLTLRVVISGSDVDVYIHDSSGCCFSPHLVRVEREGGLIKVMYRAEDGWKPALICHDAGGFGTVVGQAIVKARRWDKFEITS